MKRVAIALMASVLGAASTQAALLTSWENAADGFSGITAYSTTTGVTDGTYSATVPVVAGWGFTMDGGYNNNFTPALQANQIISMDVTLATPLPAGQWFQTFFQLQTGAGTGTPDVGYFVIDPTGLTTHVTFNYSGVYLPAVGTPWTQVRIGTNTSGGFVPNTMYIDNLQVTAVPEPTSLGLLGLGSLALLRRRRA